VVFAFTQKPENQKTRIDIPVLIEPKLLRAARQIYRTYWVVNPNLVKRATGVAINKLTYRGTLVFSSKPIILLQECFVPLSQLDQISLAPPGS
jgi:hypothetical protein